MLGTHTKISVEEFDRFVDLPENFDKLFEYIGGELVEVLSNVYVSKIAGIISGELYIFLKGKDLGHLTGAAGGYQIVGERYAPDVAFISKNKQFSQGGYNPDPPDLAVEVDFPSTYQSISNLIPKIVNYLSAGTIVWLVIPESKIVEIFAPGQPKKSVGIDGVLDGGDLLPGFKLAVKDIFPEQN